MRYNQRKSRIIKQTKNITVITAVISLFMILSVTLFNNKILVKETKNNLKALDQEGQTYRLVTSADNVQVPVPKGYVASGVTGENYVTPEYQHTTITHKVSTTPTVLTWSSPEGEQYPWTQDENGIWISGNQGIPNSEEFDYIKGTTLTIKCIYSCSIGDYLNIDLINLTNNTEQRIINNFYGNNTGNSFDYTTSSSIWTMNDWGTGRYKIRAIYSKNGSGNGGQDSGYIKTSTYFKEDENGMQTIEEDIKTKIHDGGFVIYQLTDEELETDPNGTSVIINDTNRDAAQVTRNQYVWVPVSNIEDIVRTKTVNNGTMQFGQKYIFNTTSITKETDTGTNYYSEPRLAEKYDKTKYFLQKFLDTKKRVNYLNNMQEDYTRMIKSVNKYKGFYIGRYETGDDYTHSSRKGFFTNPKIVRYNGNINWVTWYDSFKDLERLSGKTEKYVETEMLYDSLWDYTLKWLQETDTRSYEEIAKSSGNWGNYISTSFKYKESANGPEITKSGGTEKWTLSGGVTEITYKGGIYSDYPTASNNIYDLAGNYSEWTRSRHSTDGRRYRGGDYRYNNYSVCYAYGDYPYTNQYGYFVARGELLIR